MTCDIKTGTCRGPARNFNRYLAVAESYPALAQIIGGHFDGDTVTGKDPDIMLAHLTRNMRGDYMPVVQFNTKHGIGKCFNNSPLHFYLVFFCHSMFVENKRCALCPISPGEAKIPLCESSGISKPAIVSVVLHRAVLCFIAHFFTVFYPVTQVEPVKSIFSCFINLQKNGKPARAS